MIKTKLIAVTKPVVGGLEDAKDLIAYCARVSNPSNQMNMDTAEKLTKYLMKYKHWSPFEMANVVVEVECPRDIARQILRHRSFSFQEFSQRYADVTQLENAFCYREARMQDSKNRQNSISIVHEDGDRAANLLDEWAYRQEIILNNIKENYKWALDNGIAKECARVILPEGLTMSRMYINGTIRSWIHYLEIRMEEGVTQLEHVQLARLIAEQVSQVFPIPEHVKNG